MTLKTDSVVFLRKSLPDSLLYSLFLLDFVRFLHDFAEILFHFLVELYLVQRLFRLFSLFLFQFVLFLLLLGFFFLYKLVKEVVRHATR